MVTRTIPGHCSGIIRVVSGIIRVGSGIIRVGSGIIRVVSGIVRVAPAFPWSKIKPAQFFVPEYTDEKWSVLLREGTVFLPCSHRHYPGWTLPDLAGCTRKLHGGTRCLPGVSTDHFSSVTENYFSLDIAARHGSRRMPSRCLHGWCRSLHGSSRILVRDDPGCDPWMCESPLSYVVKWWKNCDTETQILQKL